MGVDVPVTQVVALRLGDPDPHVELVADTHCDCDPVTVCVADVLDVAEYDIVTLFVVVEETLRLCVAQLQAEVEGEVVKLAEPLPTPETETQADVE